MKREIVKVPVAAGVVIKQNGKYLLVQENEGPAKGLWNLPAGKVDVGDTIEETAAREAKEETGYEVELVRKLGIWQEDINKAVKHYFEARVTGGELNYPKDEIMDARWFSVKEIKGIENELRNTSVIEAIKILENGA